MMQKKGAIEFSMTTIIVVIIGVIILAIAIPWLTGTLRQAGGLTDAAFDKALNELRGDPTPDEPIMLSQESFTLKRGEKAALIVRFLNTEDAEQELSFTNNNKGWFAWDNSRALIGQVHDWRVVVNVPSDASEDNFFRAEVGTNSVPMVITVE